MNILTLPPFDLRSYFDVWYLSSPEAAEVVERRTQEAEGVVLTYWDIDEQVTEPVAREAGLARDAVAGASAPPLRLRLVPAQEFAGGACGSELARYDQASDEIVLHALWSDAQRTELSGAARDALLEEVRRWAGRPRP